MRTIGFDGITLRFIFALLLVFLTYNPSGFSYFHWAKDTMPGFTPILAICGLVLLIAWGIFLRATFRSLGVLGLILAGLLFASFVWLFIDLGWFSLDNVTVMTWIVLFILSALLTVGISWSHIRRRLSGQVDVDDVEDNL